MPNISFWIFSVLNILQLLRRKLIPNVRVALNSLFQLSVAFFKLLGITRFF